MSAKIFLMNAFNAESVADHFGIPRDDECAHKAVRFLFRAEMDDYFSEEDNHRRKPEHVGKKIKAQGKNRYDLFRHHMDNFFAVQDGYKPHKDAMTLAVICGDYVHITNHNDVDDPLYFKTDIQFNENTAIFSRIFYEASLHLNAFGEAADGSFEYPESRYLAHIFAIEKLQRVVTEFNDLSHDDFSNIFKSHIPNIRAFMDERTSIGQKLAFNAQSIENMMTAFLKQQRLLPAPSPARATVPKLTLIPGGTS